MVSVIVVGVAAYVAGCFSPAVGRKLKAALKSDEAKAVADVKTVESDVAKKV